MIEGKIYYLFLTIIISILINILSFKIINKKIFILELFWFTVFFICFLYFNKDIFSNLFEILYLSFFYFSTLGVYTFTMIMIFEGSPSLKILKLIKHKKNLDKNLLKKLFLKNSFFDNRLKDLIEKNYIKKKNNYLYLTNKNKWILKIFIILEKLQGNKDNG